MSCGATSTGSPSASRRVDAPIAELAPQPHVERDSARLLHVDEEEPPRLGRAAQTASGEYSAGEAEAPKNQLSIAHRLFCIVGSAAVEWRKSSSKSSTSPGSKIGRSTPPSPAASSATCGETDHSKIAPSVPVGHEMVEPPQHHVHPGRLVAAAGEREPDVQRSDIAHEGAVLVPAVSGVRIDPPQRALLHRDHRRLPEVAPDGGLEADPVEGVEHLEEQVRGVGGPEATAPRDPVPAQRLAEGRSRHELAVERRIA